MGARNPRPTGYRHKTDRIEPHRTPGEYGWTELENRRHLARMRFAPPGIPGVWAVFLLLIPVAAGGWRRFWRFLLVRHAAQELQRKVGGQTLLARSAMLCQKRLPLEGLGHRGEQR